MQNNKILMTFDIAAETVFVDTICLILHFTYAVIQSNVRFGRVSQSLEHAGVEGLAQGPEGEITVSALGLEPVPFPSHHRGSILTC